MKKITSGNFAQFLIDNFREFTEYDRENIDIPHVIVGNFAALLVAKIESNPKDDFVRKTFDLINSLFSDSDDNKLLDLIQIELFENLAQSEKSILFSRDTLNDKAKAAFEKAMDGFGVKSMRLAN